MRRRTLFKYDAAQSFHAHVLSAIDSTRCLKLGNQDGGPQTSPLDEKFVKRAWPLHSTDAEAQAWTLTTWFPWRIVEKATIFAVDLRSGDPPSKWIRRGVALLCSRD